MKKVLLLASLAPALSLSASNWKIDEAHTKIGFTAKYLVISDVDGEFKKFNGTFTSAKEDWSDLKADVSVDVSSINTNNETRDKHLRNDDFFNAEKFPVMSFKTESVKSLGDRKYVLNGFLTIRDVTKKVSLPLVYGGTMTDPWGNVKAGFKATGKINRQDFGLKYSNALATGEAVVGDEVEFTIDAILIKEK